MKWHYFAAGPLWQRFKLRQYHACVARANALEEGLQARSDDDLQEEVAELRRRAQGLPNIHTLLPAALALGREMSRRRLGMRHYDVQLVGALALFEGHIAEMDTGEGKTLMAPMAAFLHKLENDRGCAHIVTANEYLAARDRQWMQPLLEGLGLTTGLIVPGQGPVDRARAYQNDVVYATAREVVFDALRRPQRQKQTSAVDAILRPESPDQINPTYDFALVDEVDSVLIDQARNPMALGGASIISPQIQIYQRANEVAGKLVRGTHYRLMQDERSIELKDEGKAESRRHAGGVLRLLPSGHRWERYITCALAARYIYKADQHYVVRDNRIILIDESTGRLLPGRQLPDGIHQAIEVCNGLPPTAELRGNLATTFQTFFRRYKKIAGMTGSASIAWREFLSVYNLAIVPIPPNRPRHRTVHPDMVFRSSKHKFRAILEEIIRIHATGRPLLIGTGSVQISEQISALLEQKGLPHDVLNAKNHTREAEIIAQAGQAERITIITNMAGRGVDIKLGPNVADKGGLYLLGTDRSYIRRLDEQLIGRVGRQGDQGDCQFFLSLRDDLLNNVDRKKKHRVRKATRACRDQPILNSGAAELFSHVQKHNDKVAQKHRNQLFRNEKHKEKLREQGLWEDWMDAR